MMDVLAQSASNGVLFLDFDQTSYQTILEQIFLRNCTLTTPRKTFCVAAMSSSLCSVKLGWMWSFWAANSTCCPDTVTDSSREDISTCKTSSSVSWICLKRVGWVCLDLQKQILVNKATYLEATAAMFSVALATAWAAASSRVNCSGSCSLSLSSTRRQRWLEIGASTFSTAAVLTKLWSRHEDIIVEVPHLQLKTSQCDWSSCTAFIIHHATQSAILQFPIATVVTTLIKYDNIFKHYWLKWHFV